MRNFVTEYAWKEREDEQGAGAILLTYDHESHGLQEGLTECSINFEGSSTRLLIFTLTNPDAWR